MSLHVRRSVGFGDHETVIETGGQVPTYAQLSRAINQVVTERDGEWCGVPMPLPGMGLVLEDRHPKAAFIADIQRIVDSDDTAVLPADDLDPDPDLQGWREVNSWRGTTTNGVTGIIHVLRHTDGRTTWGLSAELSSRNRLRISAFEVLDAWNLETELTAIDRLAELLTERMFKAYVFTGAFLETSKRSGLSYWFRRLAPTVVMTPHQDPTEMRILCALCLHPLGYYAATRVGAMTPTDDVIAHLLLMRGDEPLFWKRANQHPAIAPEAGL